MPLRQARYLFNLVLFLILIIVCMCGTDLYQINKVRMALNAAQKVREDRIKFGDEWRSETTKQMQQMDDHIRDLQAEVFKLQNKGKK